MRRCGITACASWACAARPDRLGRVKSVPSLIALKVDGVGHRTVTGDNAVHMGFVAPMLVQVAAEALPRNDVPSPAVPSAASSGLFQYQSVRSSAGCSGAATARVSPRATHASLAHGAAPHRSATDAAEDRGVTASAPGRERRPPRRASTHAFR